MEKICHFHGSENLVPTLTTTIQHSFGSPSHSNQRRNKTLKGIQIGKEEVKLCLQMT